MELSIQERLKDLRVERGLTLEQLAEETHLSKSALGSYEGDKFKDISHYALIQLAKFYEVSVDYLLGRSQTKNHPNADLADLRLSDDMIELLKSGRVDNSLLCELAAHPDFPRLMADLEIYVNGVAGKQVQSANAIVDAVSATIMKQHNPGLTDPQLRQLITAHIDEDSFCRYVIQQDINKIALDLREAHKNDFFSVPEDNPLEDFLQTAEDGLFRFLRSTETLHVPPPVGHPPGRVGRPAKSIHQSRRRGMYRTPGTSVRTWQQRV